MDKIDIQAIKPLLEASRTDFAGVFGSYAKGLETNESDVDILVRFREPMSLIHFIRLENNLSEKLGKRVDLVTEAALSPYIRESVLADLKTIYGAR